MLTNPVYFLETLAANAWPALVVQVMDGWRLRYGWGVTRRANSVWPNSADGRHTLAEKLSLVEDFYGRRHAPPRYQISPAAQPADLDEILSERGYTAVAHTQVMTAATDAVLAQMSPPPFDQIVLHEPFDVRWLTFHQQTGGLDTHTAAVREQILRHIGPRTAYVRIEQQGETVGIGLGVFERGWLGIFNMLTHPACRRQGVASAILRRLAQWGHDLGAADLYLQVMDDNRPARQLYERAGFVAQYGYHYRQTAAG